MTRDAIRHYQRVVGLEQTGTVDATLLRHLGATGSVSRPAPIPEPRPKSSETAALAVSPRTPSSESGATITRIQAGLRAFGNSQIAIDGIAGAQTEAAIREFQVIFGLEPTGRADESVLAKMRDLGLAD
jgi:peptidoglycan hydrolase-like protein with peptidoglycan-binding domain